jgi:methylthioribose-1-phosphate isomerase
MTAQPHLESLEGIKYKRGSLQLLDQRVLPFTVTYDDILTVEDTHRSIREMRVRGAPAIAVSAALGVAVHAQSLVEAGDEKVASVEAAKKFLLNSLDYVATSRPTAVNLFNAVADLKAKVEKDSLAVADGKKLVESYVAHAEASFHEDIEFNTNIMKFGAAHLLKSVPETEKLNIVTICNTGALATARYGTALGVIRQLHYLGRLNRVYALETRPWNQGARLTVFECVHEKMPVTLVVDNAISSLMRSVKIHAAIAGADRVCQNGDTANKIGTYNVAVAAKFHGVPFFVAAPITTLDPKTASGDKVHIEERDSKEITHNMATGQRMVVEGETLTVWNPVFDITPGSLITGGLMTDKGVITPAAAEPYYNISGILSA